MSLTFVINYDKEKSWQFDGVDAYWGTKSLAAIAQVLLLVIHASINEEVVVQAPSAKGFRVVLGKSREGSWEQFLSLVPTDPKVASLLADLGKEALYDILKWAFLSGVGIRHLVKSRKAKKRIRELELEVEDLQERLGHAINEAHLPVKNQHLIIKIMGGRTLLAEFNQGTLEYLETEIEEKETSLIYAGVSRFNARTGWGRCIDAMESQSIPFSPQSGLSRAQKTRLADNLSKVARGKFEPVPMIVSQVTSQSGVLKRYKLHDVPESD